MDDRRAGRDRRHGAFDRGRRASWTRSPKCWTPRPASTCCTRARCRSSDARGARLWSQLVETIAERWDDVIDAIDDMIDTPAVDATALAAAEKRSVVDDEAADDLSIADTAADDEDDLDEEEAPAGSGRRSASTPSGSRRMRARSSRCVATSDDKPVFLGTDGKIEAFGASAHWPRGSRARARRATTSPRRRRGRRSWRGRSDLEVTVDSMNSYVLAELDGDLAEGTTSVDPARLGWPPSCCSTSASGRATTTRAGAGRVAAAGVAGVVHRQARPHAARAEPAFRRRVGEAARADRRAGGPAQPGTNASAPRTPA